MPNWLLIPGASLKPTPWRNGRGTTRDVVSHYAPDGAFAWQISIADLVQDAEFSHYPDCDRIFTPIPAGSESEPTPELVPQLAIDGGPFEPCPLLIPKPFPGDVPTLSRIPAPARAFNLVYDRRRHHATVSVLTLPPGTVVEPPATPFFVVHCLQGRMVVADGALLPGDSLFGPDPTAPLETTEDTAAILVSITEL